MLQIYWPKIGQILVRSSVFSLNALLKNIGKGLSWQFRLLLKMNLVDLILSHCFFRHSEQELDGRGAINQVTVVQPASEIPAKEGNDVDDGAT
jgi:hypothetical protein